MSGDLHPLAATGFAAAADAYERARPTYPREAVRWFTERTGLGAGTTIVDLAAGTGKLTRALVTTGATVIAVEPISEMRARLNDALPGVQALEGTAEAIPLPSASADCVAVGQAFHWFRAPEALDDIARVLRPGGWLALFWNTRDVTHPLQKAIDDVLSRSPRRAPLAREGQWRDSLEASSHFGRLEQHSVQNPLSLTREGLRDRIASTSFVAAMPEPEREALLARVMPLVDGSEEPFAFPYVTDVFLTRRLA